MTDEERYITALHAMQSGVAWEMNMPVPQAATEPKHLRVGINNTLVQHTAVIKLLMEKGIITLDEYWKTLADEMEAEVQRYQDRANATYGRDNVIRFR
jgi:hypothetical protein